MKNLMLVMGLIGSLCFISSANAQVSKHCQEVIAKTAATAAVADYVAAGMNPNDIPDDVAVKHIKEVDLPAAVELYKMGGEFARNGYSRGDVEFATRKAANDTRGLELMNPKQLNALKESAVETAMCGYDDALVKL